MVRLLSMKKFICLFLLLLPFRMAGQFVNYGTDPSSFKWRQVKIENFQLIYPMGNDSIAYNYARYLAMVYPHEVKTIGHLNKGRFPVILHPGNMLSNGMVAFAPKRMEMIPTPSPTLYAQSWDRQLVLHESRHVLQTDKLMQGVFKPFYYLLGEQISAVSSFAVPTWFFEGDAVSTETAMSNSGRGRLPEFHMPFRAQKVTGDFFSFDKWYMGSYKDYTSTYYALGYHMTAYARYAYGASVWDKVTHRFPRRFFSIPPFSNALKHYTGKNTKQLFNDTYHFLNKEWQKQDSLYQMSDFKDRVEHLSPEVESYTSYQCPVVMDSGEVIALKTGLSEISSIVRIVNGVESRLTYTGSVNSSLLLVGNNLYWMEYVSGLRWTHQNYSVLKKLNLATLKVETVTTKERYLTPAVSADETQVAFSRPTIEGRNEIVLMDLKNEEKKIEFSIPENAFVKDLTFIDEARLAVLAVDNKGISLYELNTVSSEWFKLLGPASTNISSLFSQEGNLYFESGADGTNNIYRMEVASGRVEQLTKARFGAFTPSVSPQGDKLLFADYQRQGYQLVAVALDKLEAESANLDEPYRFQLAEAIADQEGFNLDTMQLQDIPFEPKPYHKLSKLFRVHSWAPFYYDAMDVVNLQSDDFSTIVKPGAMLLSQNALNTMIAQAGWYYKDREHHGKIAFTYMGLFPVIDVSLDYGGKTIDLVWKENEDGVRYPSVFHAGRKRLELEARMYVPFNFTHNHMVRGFQPIVTYYYTNDRYEQYKKGGFGDFQYVLSELRHYNYRKKAARDIYPRLGYQLRLQHLFSPFNSENFGHMYAARFTGYLPGLRMNDGLMLRLAYQFQDTDGKAMYFPKRLLEKPRGYDYMYQTRQLFSLKADYAFSLFCPDYSLGNLLYLKRFRSNLFYDLTVNQVHKAQKNWNKYNAVGVDLIADCNFFRLNFPVSIGMRLTQPIDFGKLQAEALFSVLF